jgi:tripartite-type tricarboxylate transporter receptor subunit TctC
VIVVNKGGASGAIAGRYVARAKPDGYTLLSSNDSVNITARVERKDAGYDLDSFRYLWFHSSITAFYSVRSDSRWKTLHDLLKEAKSNPGKLKYGAMGPAAPANMSMMLLCDVAGVKMTYVPFKSSPESLLAVAGGNVDVAVTFSLAGMGTSGMIRTLAISDDKRVPDYPNIPTLKELGYSIPYKGMYMGMCAPRETPEKVVSKLIEAHNKVRIKYAKEIKEKLPQIDQYDVYLGEKDIMPYLKEREKLFSDFYSKIGFKAQ